MSAALPWSAPYRAVLDARLRAQLQYRGAAAAGVATQVFWGLIRVMIFTAFYRSSPGPHPLTREQTVTYVWMGQILFRLLPWRMDPDLAAAFRQGQVAYELLRPVDLYGYWWMRHLGRLLGPTLLQSLPVALVAWGLGELGAPASREAAFAWLLATLGAALLGAALLTTVAMWMFWTLVADGLMAMYTAAMLLMSGMVVPLALLPGWAGELLAWLPFQALVDAPLGLYLGTTPAGEVGRVLAVQLAWILILQGLGRALLRVGTRRLVVQGG